jgi:hypothetical protein
VTAGFGLRLLPQSFEPVPSNRCVVCRVLGIAVPEVVLHGPEIGALICKVITAGMAEHVRPDPAELSLLASDPHDIVDGLAGGREHRGYRRLASGRWRAGSFGARWRNRCLELESASNAARGPYINGVYQRQAENHGPARNK